jgi:hypothetical protein
MSHARAVRGSVGRRRPAVLVFAIRIGAGVLTRGHRDVRTTMTYLHAMQRGALGLKSPMDRL